MIGTSKRGSFYSHLKCLGTLTLFCEHSIINNARMEKIDKEKKLVCPLCKKHCIAPNFSCICGPQLFSDSDDLFRLMRKCGHVLYHSQEQNNGQGRIIHILSIRGSISQVELQKLLNIQPGSLSEIVGKLEAKGYLTKEKDEKDQRRMILKITAKGKKTPEEELYLKSRENLFSALDTEEQEELKKLLQKLLNQWMEESGGK